MARVLVVDDDPSMLSALGALLRSSGHQAVAAQSAKEALAVLDGGIEAVVTDYSMPEMNGLELVRRIRRDRPELKVLFMTGYADTADIEAESVDVPTLRKPFRVAELSDKVASVLRGGAPSAVAV